MRTTFIIIGLAISTMAVAQEELQFEPIATELTQPEGSGNEVTSPEPEEGFIIQTGEIPSTAPVLSPAEEPMESEEFQEVEEAIDPKK